jgi:hypothetical protein
MTRARVRGHSRTLAHTTVNFRENERLQAFNVIWLLVIIGGFVLARPLRRANQEIGDGLWLAAHLAARLATVVVGGLSGIRAVDHGTLPYVALGVLLLIVAAGAVVMSVIFLVALVQTFRSGAHSADA